MIRRLSAIDLTTRLRKVAPPWVVAAGVGLVGAVVAVALRLLIDVVAPGAVPFALLFPTILLATVLAGWGAGTTTAVLGGVASWVLIVEPKFAFTMHTLDGAVTVILYTIAAGAIVAVTAIYRAIALAQAREGDRIAAERAQLIEEQAQRRKSEQRLKESEARLRLALGAGRMAVWQLDVRSGLMTVSRELNLMTGWPADATPSLEDFAQGYAPGERERVRAVARAAHARGERFFTADYEYRRADGAMRWMELRAEMLLGATGKLVGGVGVLMDVTDRKADEERLRLLAREVDHRANNLLAVVQGTVQLSRASTAEELKRVIVGRVAALARAHQLLSAARWQGADLRRLVEEELLAFSLGDGARVVARGEDVALGPAAAQAIAMALHELATNAAKYGGLSNPAGRVEVDWVATEDGALVIRWCENGGPSVARPTRRGLGTALLERALAGQLGGSVRMDWRAEGLACELVLPAEALRIGGEPMA